MQNLIQLDTSVQTSKMQKKLHLITCHNMTWKFDYRRNYIFNSRERTTSWFSFLRKKKMHDTIWGSLIKSERCARLGVCINHGSTDRGFKPVSCWCCRVQSLASPVNPQAFHLQSTGHQAQWSAIGETKLGETVSRTQEHFDEHRGIQSNMS